MPKEYVATLRASFQADNDAEAMLVADDIGTAALIHVLEEDAGDEIIVTQVIDYAPADTPQEIITILTKARNTLINIKLQKFLEMARELDILIYALEQGDYDLYSPYDQRFMDVVEQVLKGESPK